jgi:lipoprotein-anchoring transpeptidase ErfK/SrfK
MLVRPSTLGLLALAVVSACVALLALPTTRSGRAADRPAPAARAATAAGAQPVPLTAVASPSRPAAKTAVADVQAARTKLSARPVATADASVPRPRAARKRPGYRTVQIRSGHSVALHAGPRGRTVATLSARTEFGSKRVLAVAAVRGRWLGVTATELPNGKIGWIDGQAKGLARGHTKMSLRVDLSQRRIELRSGSHVVARMAVAVGRPGSPTPAGRFAVTDKLSGGSYGPYYGCCILALSGHQPSPPPGWPGGNRLAIHGTNAPGAIGTAASAGCLRGSDKNLRVLMRRVPVGTPVFIRR